MNSPPEISLANPHHWDRGRLGSDSAIYANSSCSSASRGSLSLSPERAHRQSGVSLSPQRPSDALTQSEFSERRGKCPASRGSLSLSPQQPRLDTDRENELSVSDDQPTVSCSVGDFVQQRSMSPGPVSRSGSDNSIALSDSEDESGQVF